MDIPVQKFDDVEVVSVEGKLEAAEVAQHKPILAKLLGQGRCRIVIDMTKLEHISYSGLNLLIEARDLARIEDGDVRIACMPSQIKEVFDLTDYTAFFEFYDDVDTAKASFGVVEQKRKDSFRIGYQQFGQVDVVTVSGRMEPTIAWQLGHVLYGLLDQGRCWIVLDLTEITYLESKGLRVIFDCTQIARNTNTGDVLIRNDGDLILAGMPPLIKEALELTFLSSAFTFGDDVKEAIKSLGGTVSD